MGFRAVLFFLIIGGAIFFYGFSEYKVSKNASATPEAISVVDLAKGVPTNPYRTLGEHQPIYQLVIYSGKKNSDSISYAYYPVTSKQHFEEVVTKLAAKHGGDVAKITEDEFSEAIDPKILIKTEQYKTLPELKVAVDKETFPSNNVNGMVVNEIQSLSSEEEKMLKERFKTFDSKSVVIFESNRVPSSTGFAFGMMGLGGLLCVGGIIAGLLGMAKGNPTQTA